MNYPETRTVDQVDEYHGVKVADPYRWLEDDNSAETVAWVEEQSRVTFEYLGGLPSRESYRERLRAMFASPRYTQPRVFGGRHFYLKNNGLQDHAVLYVEDPVDRLPQVILDPNTFSTDGTVSLSDVGITMDGSLIAYSRSDSGSDWQEIHVRDVGASEDRAECVPWVKFSTISWTHDNGGFFYSRYPAPVPGAELSGRLGVHAIYYHRLGTDQSADLLIHSRPDLDDCFLFAQVTDDGRYIIIGAHRHGKDSVLYADLGDPLAPRIDAPVGPLVGSFEGEFMLIGNDGPTIYLRTQQDAPRGSVVAVDTANANAVRTVIAESADVLEWAALVRDRFVLAYLHNAHSRIALADMEGKIVGEIALPTIGSAWMEPSRRDTDDIFYMFTSFLYPPTIFRYNLMTGAQGAHWPIDDSLDAQAYQTDQRWFRSKDGTDVPMFVTHRRGLELNGSTPTLVYGYGGFGTPMTPMYLRFGRLWIEEGGVFVVVCARGGGEFGEEWHRNGIREHKQHTFDDFIGAAEYLIEHRYASPGTMALLGASNGGLVVSAVICQRPDLFAVALPQVAVTDMLRYDQFTVGRGCQGDYGLSEEPEMFPVLYAYSPLHNVKPGVHYPATLVATSDHDDRVVPAHSFKFAARLQACQGNDVPILLRVTTGAGHGMGKTIPMIIDETADTIAFALDYIRS